MAAHLLAATPPSSRVRGPLGTARVIAGLVGAAIMAVVWGWLRR